ncbi:MAG TPA: hypothetical protein VKU61_12875 [Candidatus Binatia bacterium]|nr:hypothetical protein [Candidatus Binatia bacterium]
MSGRLLVAAVLVAGCAMRGEHPASPTPTGGAFGLIVEGSALVSGDARAGLGRRLEAVTGHPVILLSTMPTVHDPDVVAAARAAVGQDRSLARRDWRAEPCVREGALLAAIANRLDAVYRVTVDRRERERPLTPAERAARDLGTKILAGIRIARRGIAREETVSGEIQLWTFARRKEPERATISYMAARPEPTPFTSHVDPAAVVEEALRKLPSPPTPTWEAVARRLIGAGCPVLGVAVAETRVSDREVRRHVRATALARPRAPSNAPTAGVRAHPPDADVAEPEQSPEPTPPDERYSCRSLCRMHMVELCNRDKALWDTHGQKWDTTSCGTMRAEGFLQDCYRRQWLSGAFQDACMSPCEGAPEGRERLLRILQEAGCLRPRRS